MNSNLNKYYDDFMYYMTMERSFSKNTIESYLLDCQRFFDFMEKNYPNITVETIETKHFDDFLTKITKKIGNNEEEKLLKATTKRRIIEGIRAFFKYLIVADVINKNPTELIVTPRLEQRLPIVLSNEEIERMIATFDVSTYSGYRNRLTIEVLYATGLRVSEFVNLKLSNIIEKENVLNVIGKGDKQRYIPIIDSALEHLMTYINEYRSQINIKQKYKDYVFINQKRGTTLTRQFIFNIIKQSAIDANIDKKIHPHILRHSFATELIKGGANIIAVKEMMGHQSVRSTEIYINLSTKELRNTLFTCHPFYNKAKHSSLF
ncbi:MAG: tyrosine-type recombinase/integrase [Bacteroidales bacterium]|nr:tyrosine-type recombinase/integrase [Bacteroidales bacterium]